MQMKKHSLKMYCLMLIFFLKWCNGLNWKIGNSTEWVDTDALFFVGNKQPLPNPTLSAQIYPITASQDPNYAYALDDCDQTDPSVNVTKTWKKI